MSIEGVFTVFKRLLGFLLFPFFVLSNIILHIFMEPAEEFWPKRKVLYFISFIFLSPLWIINFLFCNLWEKLFE